MSFGGPSYGSSYPQPPPSVSTPQVQGVLPNKFLVNPSAASTSTPRPPPANGLPTSGVGNVLSSGWAFPAAQISRPTLHTARSNPPAVTDMSEFPALGGGGTSGLGGGAFSPGGHFASVAHGQNMGSFGGSSVAAALLGGGHGMMGAVGSGEPSRRPGQFTMDDFPALSGSSTSSGASFPSVPVTAAVAVPVTSASGGGTVKDALRSSSPLAGSEKGKSRVAADVDELRPTTSTTSLPSDMSYARASASSPKPASPGNIPEETASPSGQSPRSQGTRLAPGPSSLRKALTQPVGKSSSPSPSSSAAALAANSVAPPPAASLPSGPHAASEPDTKYRMAGLRDMLLSGHADRASLGLGTGLDLDIGPATPHLDYYIAPWLEPAHAPLDPARFKLPAAYAAVRPPPPAQHKMGSFSDSTLFYIFYVMTGDVLQEAAAQELYNRDWRYNREERYWLTRAPKSSSPPPSSLDPRAQAGAEGSSPSASSPPPSSKGGQGTEAFKTGTHERGRFLVFDVSFWRPDLRDLTFAYADLEERPSLINGGVNASVLGVHPGMSIPSSLPMYTSHPSPPSQGHLYGVAGAFPSRGR